MVGWFLVQITLMCIKVQIEEQKIHVNKLHFIKCNKEILHVSSKAVIASIMPNMLGEGSKITPQGPLKPVWLLPM